MKELLFIGGPSDGERIQVDDDKQYVRMPAEVGGGTVEYRRERLYGGADISFDVMFHSENGESLLEAIIKGY